MTIPGYQIGDNLYGDDQGRYFSIQNGKYQLPNGGKWMNGTHRVFQSSPWDTEQNQVNSLYGAQQKQQLGALKAQQQTALNGLNLQQKNSNAGFYTQRNQADVTSAQNAQHMRETMAANGLNMSGENVTATAGLNSQRMGALNDINTQQNQANAQFASQRADINNPQHAQDIINQINAAKSQALMDAFHNYMSRLDNQHSQYESQLQNDRSFNENKRQFDLSQKQNQGQYDSSQAYQYWLAKQNLAQNSGANGSGFQSSGGGGGTAGTASFQKNLAEANKRGLSKSENNDLSWIISHESSFNPNAQNKKSTAYGYGQFLNATRQQYEKKMGMSYSDPVNQILMTDQYSKDRYGSVANAKKFWQQHGWY